MRVFYVYVCTCVCTSLCLHVNLACVKVYACVCERLCVFVRLNRVTLTGPTQAFLSLFPSEC